MLIIKIRDYFAEDWSLIEILLRTNPKLDYIDVKEERKLINLYLQQYDFGRTSVAINESNQLIGYMIMRYYRRSAFIETIFVDLKSQKKGVGSQLIDFAKKLAVVDDAQVLRVAVPEDNQGAIQFFITNNFQIAGYIKSDYSFYTNNVHLVLSLAEVTF